MAYLNLIRPKNLLIVAFTQLFFQYVIIVPVFRAAGLSLALSPLNLGLLILCTLLITAGGNIINDYYDLAVDKYNNRRSSSALLDSSDIFKFYIVVVFLGAAIALYVAYEIANLSLFWIYPAAVTTLFLYSYRLKHIPLLGNIIVSLFTALVIYILLFAEKASISELGKGNNSEYDVLIYCCYGFMIFAFLSNLIREIIKDLEDKEGDEKYGSRTLPIVIGDKWAKNICYFLLTILIIGLGIWPQLDIPTNFYGANKIYIRAVLTLPVFYAFGSIYKAESKQQYHEISQLLKLYMILGLLYLPFYYIS